VQQGPSSGHHPGNFGNRGWRRRGVNTTCQSARAVRGPFFQSESAHATCGRCKQTNQRMIRSTSMSEGKVVQIIGAVVDVEFPRDAVPKVYDALIVADVGLTLEVQQ